MDIVAYIFATFYTAQQPSTLDFGSLLSRVDRQEISVTLTPVSYVLPVVDKVTETEPPTVSPTPTPELTQQQRQDLRNNDCIDPECGTYKMAKDPEYMVGGKYGGQAN